MLQAFLAQGFEGYGFCHVEACTRVYDYIKSREVDIARGVRDPGIFQSLKEVGRKRRYGARVVASMVLSNH